MQQTALNLIAIGVFSITFLSLLSPLFNISPAVPAVITVGIMGLATIDTLGWQNKGVTLLLDSFSSSQERERIVRHEAGHFLAAYFLGIPITGYTLTAWEAFKQGQPGRGGVIFDLEALSKTALVGQQFPLILERFCTVCMAGIAAEIVLYDRAAGGEDDRQKLREALQLAGLPPKVYQQKERWAQLQATNLIKKHGESYQALVKAMAARATVEDCYRAIQQNLI